MAIFLRNLPDGTRFMLCRTREKFSLIGRKFEYGRTRIVVQSESDNRPHTLHHSCHVKLLVKDFRADWRKGEV